MPKGEERPVAEMVCNECGHRVPAEEGVAQKTCPNCHGGYLVLGGEGPVR